jgi:hypothetical protein
MKTYYSPIAKVMVFLKKNYFIKLIKGIHFQPEKNFLFEPDINSRRKQIDHDLAQACAEAEKEDRSINEDWEPITLEIWKGAIQRGD